MCVPSADADAKYGSIVGLCWTDDVDVDVATDVAEAGDVLLAGYVDLDCEFFCTSAVCKMDIGKQTDH